MSDLDIYGGNSMTYRDYYLEHYGVKGMKWGVITDHRARKDAKEFARAKMFYGEGAGTRRKLIKNKVESRTNKDPNYKSAFDHHLSRQDMGKHVSKAKSERRHKDVKKSVAKTARGARHTLNGNSQYSSIAGVALASGIAYAHSQGYDKIVYNSIKSTTAMKRAAEFVDVAILKRR